MNLETQRCRACNGPAYIVSMAPLVLLGQAIGYLHWTCAERIETFEDILTERKIKDPT